MAPGANILLEAKESIDIHDRTRRAIHSFNFQSRGSINNGRPEFSHTPNLLLPLADTQPNSSFRQPSVWTDNSFMTVADNSIASTRLDSRNRAPFVKESSSRFCFIASSLYSRLQCPQPTGFAWIAFARFEISF